MKKIDLDKPGWLERLGFNLGEEGVHKKAVEYAAGKLQNPAVYNSELAPLRDESGYIIEDTKATAERVAKKEVLEIEKDPEYENPIFSPNDVEKIRGILAKKEM